MCLYSTFFHWTSTTLFIHPLHSENYLSSWFINWKINTQKSQIFFSFYLCWANKKDENIFCWYACSSQIISSHTVGLLKALNSIYLFQGGYFLHTHCFVPLILIQSIQTPDYMTAKRFYLFILAVGGRGVDNITIYIRETPCTDGFISGLHKLHSVS